jgi:hypothetical protein
MSDDDRANLEAGRERTRYQLARLEAERSAAPLSPDGIVSKDIYEVTCKNAPNCTNTYRYITTKFNIHELHYELMQAGWQFEFEFVTDENNETRFIHGYPIIERKSDEITCPDCALPQFVKRINRSL